jgi:hypothetical protein
MKPAASNNQSRTEEVASQDKVRLLKLLVVELQEELLSEVQASDVEGGLDFFNEVSRFEINLIKLALIITGGYQGRLPGC